MTHLEMVSIVVAATQYVKEIVRKWIPVEGFVSIILAGLVSACIVGYKFLNEGLAFDFGAFMSMVIAVTAEAALGKMAIKPAFKGLKGTVIKKAMEKASKEVK